MTVVPTASKFHIPHSSEPAAPAAHAGAGYAAEAGPVRAADVGVAGLPPLVPDPAAHGEPFPLTPTQQALWVGRADAVELGNVGCYGYFEWERDELDVARYRRAWERLVEHHPGLRTVVRPDGSQNLGGCG